mmetsp:Transcript_31229/g.85706  ORF Transcript_31229/g.85706 Transcript_31229/m.85706 type:complete len:306 (-) Transcript_31229:66-983(-)
MPPGQQDTESRHLLSPAASAQEDASAVPAGVGGTDVAVPAGVRGMGLAAPSPADSFEAKPAFENILSGLIGGDDASASDGLSGDATAVHRPQLTGQFSFIHSPAHVHVRLLASSVQSLAPHTGPPVPPGQHCLWQRSLTLSSQGSMPTTSATGSMKLTMTTMSKVNATAATDKRTAHRLVRAGFLSTSIMPMGRLGGVLLLGGKCPKLEPSSAILRSAGPTGSFWCPLWCEAASGARGAGLARGPFAGPESARREPADAQGPSSSGAAESGGPCASTENKSGCARRTWARHSSAVSKICSGHCGQ